MWSSIITPVHVHLGFVRYEHTGIVHVHVMHVHVLHLHVKIMYVIITTCTRTTLHVLYIMCV